jgi:GPH family glycoside/pentoside/hexuronide:cation symporter
MIFSVLGYILGAALTTILVGIFEGQGMDTHQAWSATGAFFGIVAIVMILITTLTIKETGEMVGEPSQLPALKAIGTSFKNKPFLKLMAAFILSSFSFTILTALVPYFITYQLKMPDQVSYVLLVMLVSIGIFLVPAKILSDRINKGPAYALGLGIASIAILFGYLLPHEPTPLIYVIAFVAGMGFSTQWVSPWSMLPDVIEYDELLTGERREGVFYGLWAFLSKFTGALGVAVAGWALAWFNYVPNAEQTSEALFGIRFFFCIVPAVVILFSLPILIRYPITRANHAELVKQLAERKATQEAAVK